MSHRTLFFLLTWLMTWGMGTVAIAQTAPVVPGEMQLAQSPSGQSEGRPDAAQQPPPSPAVQSLQSRLAELGYYAGPIDGIYGSGTRNALVQFQQNAGLAGTGILDPLTQERLNNATPTGGETPADNSTALPNLDTSETPEGGSPPAATGATTDPAPSPPAETPATAPEGTAATGETPAPASEAGTPATGDNTAAGAAPADAEAAPEAPPQRELKILPLILIGLAIVVVVGFVGGWGLLRARSRKTGEADDAEADDLTAVNPDDDAFITPAVPRVVNNGAHSTVASGSSSWTNPATPTLKSASSQPKLAKVNIIEELIQDLENPDPTSRRKAIWELGQRGNSAAVQPLVRLMVDADSHEQSIILAALAEISMQTLKPMNRALALSLQNENPEVRKNAIRDLTRIYDSLGQVGRLLGHAASDSDPDVRQTAHWALDQLNHLRLSATESAALLQDGSLDRDRLPGDGSSSHVR